MGGANSRRWSIDYVRQDVVESCQRIAMKEFYRLGFLELGNRQVAKGTLVEMETSNRALRIRLDGSDIDKPRCWARWRRDDGPPVVQRLKIEIVQSRFDTPRFYFICPLGAAGAKCRGRVAILYLPPGADSLGCRLCHRLTYKSVRAYELERGPRKPKEPPHA